MWFTENAWPPMFLAGLCGLILLAVWNSNRRGRYLVAAAVCWTACVGCYFLERAIVTEGERLQQIVVSLCDDFRHKRQTTLGYISDAAPQLKLMMMGAMAIVEITDGPRLTDFQTSITNQNSRGRIHFRANATLSVTGHGSVGHHPARLVLTFQREKDQWKIIEIERLNPLSGERMELLAQQPG